MLVKADITKHVDHEAVPKSEQWYALFKGQCPICGTVGAFQEVEVEDVKIGKISLRGLSSGEKLRY